MTVLYAAFWVTSLVLIAAGTTKLAGPEAFAAMFDPVAGRRSGLLFARLVGVVEVVVGFLALAVGTRVVAALVGLLYALFAVVVVVAMTRELPTCGCFGAASSAPTAIHVFLNVLSAVIAMAAATTSPPSMARELSGRGILALAIVAGVLAATVAVVFVETKPRAATFSRNTSTGGSNERNARR